MTQKDRLPEEVKERGERITQLERRLAKGEKIKGVLMDRVERSVDSAGDPYSMSENNILLQQRIEQRTQELADANQKLKVQITERGQDEAALRDSQEKLAGVMDAVTDHLSLIDEQYNVVWANDALKDIFGSEMIGKKCHAAYFRSDRPCEPCVVKKTFSDSKIHQGEREFTAANGKNFTMWCTSNVAARYPDGRPRLVIEILRDRTDRKLAEEALRNAYQIINRSPAVAFLWKNTEGWPVEFVSDNVKNLFGYTAEEFTSGKPRYAETIHPDDLERVSQEVRIYSEEKGRKEFVHKPYRIITKNGEIKYLDDRTYMRRDKDGRITHYEGIVLDVTQCQLASAKKKELEGQLRQAQKMEAIGTLAGGIAHDFNNILAAILGYTELLMEDVPRGSTAKANLEEILNAGIRARNLVGQILAFSRQGRQEQKAFQVSPIIKEALKLLRASLATTIEIRQNIGGESISILADPTEIHQVLINLCTNAAHAMQEKGGTGVLEVTLDVVDLDADAAARHPDLKPGSYARLAVSDTGCGMDQTVLERVFDPFFTTKAVGEGTGMGLSVVHGIVKSHHGAIMADSEPGKGTTFQIFFPRIEANRAQEGGAVDPMPTGNERILFVDDEKPLVDIGKRMLERLGYEVVGKTSSIEALDAFRAQPDQFDLVITDLTMPNMTGKDLQKELVAIRQDIPVVLCTGFSNMISEKEAKALGISELVMKPVVRGDMARTIRRVLDQQSA
jgi:PAS domain S-box-containing protein